MQNLLTDPYWQAETLGRSMPDSPHAISVSLPCWTQVVAYEEGDAAVVERLRGGYPRFFLPGLTQRLFTAAEQRYAGAGEGCVVFPSRAAADRCVEFVRRTEPDAALRLEAWEDSGAWVVIFAEANRASVRLYWRFSGEIVSSRWSLALLEGQRNQAIAGAPAKRVLQQRLARYARVGEDDVFLFPSGMAAVFAVQRMLQRLLPGRRSAQVDFPYVDVLKIQERFGEGVHFYSSLTDASLQEISNLAAEGLIHGVYAEVPSNPLLSCVPLQALSDLMRASGIPLVVDDTIATVLNVDALKFADVVTTSLSKSFSGTGDLLAGAVTLNPQSIHHAAMQAFLSQELLSNDIFWWEDAVALEVNSRDFPKRTRRSNMNAEALAEFLASHPKVERVYFPSRNDAGLAQILRIGGMLGCLLSFTLRKPERAPALYDALRVCKGPSLGMNFTLVCPYTLLAHYHELEWAAQYGVPSHLLRVSTGLEETSDLLERFAQALKVA